MNKQQIVAVAIVTALGTAAITSTNAFAQTSDTSTNPMTSLVQKIADKFGLNVSDVQSVFDEERTARQAEMEANYEARLNQLVSDGKITEDQKTLIMAKHEELQANRQNEMGSMRDKTSEERKAAMDQQRQDLQQWADQNGIDLQYVMGFGGPRGGHGGFGRPDFDGDNDTFTSPTTTNN